MEDFKLRIFTVLYHTGSFTAAAAELGISQPAVSQNISELEKSLGTSLFVRSRGKLEITPAGKIFLHYAQNILDGYAALNSAFTSAPHGGGKLDIYFSPALREILSRDVLSVISILRPGLVVKAVEDIGLAGISVMESTDKKRKDTGITIDVHVFPQSHPLSRLVNQAVEISRYWDVLPD